MSESHQTLQQRWREQLASNQAALAGGSLRLGWLHLMYVRLFGFLLSTYRDRRPAGEESPDSEAMPFCDHTTQLKKTPAKSDAEIRKTLKLLHAAVEPPPPGRYVDGLDELDWVTIASLSGARKPKECHQILREHGVGCRLLNIANDILVQVPHHQFEQARSLLNYHRRRVRLAQYASALARHRSWNVAMAAAGALLVLTLTGGAIAVNGGSPLHVALAVIPAGMLCVLALALRRTFQQQR